MASLKISFAALVGGTVALFLAGCGNTGSYTVAAEPGRDNVRGNPAAPVVIEEWADYQCPACGNFAKLPPQLDQSVKDNGGARLVFWFLVFFGLVSLLGAVALRGRVCTQRFLADERQVPEHEACAAVVQHALF